MTVLHENDTFHETLDVSNLLKRYVGDQTRRSNRDRELLHDILYPNRHWEWPLDYAFTYSEALNTSADVDVNLFLGRQTIREHGMDLVLIMVLSLVHIHIDTPNVKFLWCKPSSDPLFNIFSGRIRISGHQPPAQSPAESVPAGC